MLGDGIIELVITDVKPSDAGAEVVNGGEVSELTGVKAHVLPSWET